MFKSFFFSLFLLFINASFAQGTSVTGKVFDEKTKEPLPFINVYFKDKKIGGKSDGYGKYKLSSPNKESSVFFSSMGFETKEIKIKPGESGTYNVYLSTSAILKKDVKVKGRRNKLPKDTIAIRIFRNVVAHKEFNRPKKFNTYQYNEYSKLEMDVANIDSQVRNNPLLKPFAYLLENKDTTEAGEVYFPIYFKETYSRNYLAKDPTRTKKIIDGDKITELLPFESVSDLLGYSFDDIDVYANDIIIQNRTFMSPVSSSGLILYRYYVEDSFKVGDRMNYKMIFAPRSKEDFGFTGKFVVEEGSWAIKEMNLGVDKRANINFVKRFDITQTFDYIQNQWVMNKDARDLSLSLSKKSKKIFNLRFKLTNIRKDIKINAPIDDEVFNGDKVQKDIGYNKKDDAFWNSHRLDSLSKTEKNIYVGVDSVMKTRAYKNFAYIARVASSGFFPIKWVNWEIGRFYQMISWNDIEGVRLKFGARSTEEFSKQYMIYPYFAYGTKDKEFKYGVEFLTNLKRKPGKWHQFGVSTSKDYFLFGQTEDVLAYDNILNSVFSKTPKPIGGLPISATSSLMKKTEFKVLYMKEHNNGIHTNFWFYSQNIYRSDRFHFTKLESNGDSTELTEVTESKLQFQLRWAPAQPVFDQPFYRRKLKGIKPELSLTTTFGIKGILKSDYSFIHFKAHLKHNYPSAIGITRYQAMAGKIFGTVPFTELEIHPGNTTVLRDDFRFLLLNNFEYASDIYASVWVDHLFNGFFLNKIPLIKKLKWREGFTGKVLWGDISQNNRNFMRLPSGLDAPSQTYAEVGFNIYNILKFLRFDFSWRVTQPGRTDVQRFKILGSFLISL